MTAGGGYSINAEAATARRVGRYAAFLTAIMALVTFALAITAIPISGANCVDGCIEYPYLNTVAQFPKDYRWMPPAMILVLTYLTLMAAIHSAAAAYKRVFSQIGLSFAILSAVVLLSDYFLQFSVIPVSLIHGETEGITLLTQYNAHGIFIVLEELGYLLMSLSLLCVAPVFGGNRLESAVRWVCITGFVLTLLALAIISGQFGLDRQDRFEVVVISINWLALTINGVLLAIVFGRQ